MLLEIVQDLESMKFLSTSRLLVVLCVCGKRVLVKTSGPMHCFANCHSFGCIWTHDKICLLLILGGWSWTSSLNITNLSQDTQWTEKPSEFITSRSLACLPICFFYRRKLWNSNKSKNAPLHHGNADASSVNETEFKLRSLLQIYYRSPSKCIIFKHHWHANMALTQN